MRIILVHINSIFPIYVNYASHVHLNWPGGKERKCKIVYIGVTFLRSSCSCSLDGRKYDGKILVTLSLSRYKKAPGQNSQIQMAKVRSLNPCLSIKVNCMIYLLFPFGLHRHPASLKIWSLNYLNVDLKMLKM